MNLAAPAWHRLLPKIQLCLGSSCKNVVIGVAPLPVTACGRPGTSLFQTLKHPHDRERFVLAEYHAAGAITEATKLQGRL